MNKPNYLPELPEGCVYLGLGSTFKVGNFFSGYRIGPGDSEWDRGNNWDGSDHDSHYCAPADSKVVRLNTKKHVYTPLKQEFIVWCPARGEPTTKHPTLASATDEAHRLAAKHPGATFHVCQILAAYVGEVTVNKAL